MGEVAGVALFTDLEWPKGTLGRRPLLVFESYDASAWRLPDRPYTGGDDMSVFLDRGFELFVPDRWTFPYLEGLFLAIHYDFDVMALNDEGDELFTYPLSALPTEWYSHLKLERNCLLITGLELHLATAGMEGVHDACARGHAAGGMLLVNDGSANL
ncbi:MAG: hypothetical protein GEU68_16120 [Actinobacteria bacterium]|nr:hypothetical protein [Actinomycetota bacterium]